MTVVAELHDIVRFCSARKLMAYLGLMPSEHSSGDSRRQGQPTPIIALADRAQQRLHRRFVLLALQCGKPSQKPVVAIARELVGFLWAALVLYPQLEEWEVTP